MEIMGIFSQMAMGNHLTKLTNIVEEIENTRRTMYAGAGGGIDSLPEPRRSAVAKEIEERITRLQKQPRHLVTRVMVGNMLISNRLGRPLRLVAQERLLQMLIDCGAALNMDDFEKSYA